MAVTLSSEMFYVACKVVLVQLVACSLLLSGCVNSNAGVDELRETMRRRFYAQMERSVLELTQEMVTSPQVTEIYGKVNKAKGRRPVVCIGRIEDAGSHEASDMQEFFREMMHVSLSRTGRFDVIEVPPPMNITYDAPPFSHYSREIMSDFFVQGCIRNSSKDGCDPCCFLVITLFCSDTGVFVWEGLRRWSGPMR